MIFSFIISAKNLKQVSNEYWIIKVEIWELYVSEMFNSISPKDSVQLSCYISIKVKVEAKFSEKNIYHSAPSTDIFETRIYSIYYIFEVPWFEWVKV